MTRWRCGAMDPPWLERGAGKVRRGADRHYPLVPTKKLPTVLMGSGLWTPHPNAHLWMWATNNFLPDALWLGDQLGFRYVTNAVWVKTAEPSEAAVNGMCLVDDLKLQIGLGQYLRGAHELLLFFVAKRGSGQADDVWLGDRSIPSVIRARRTRHSEKPQAAYDLIERVSGGPRVEFFARDPRPGWTVWGNEIDATTEASE